MKKVLLIAVLCAFGIASLQAQNGTVKGTITEEQNGAQVPLPFANVFIEGTTTGGTSDFDGNFTFSAPEGTHMLICSFMGYETFKKEITVTDGGTITVAVPMKTEGVAIEGVEVVAKVNRESEMALIMEQKKATVIKESIGAQQLSSMGVSDAAGATTKISGVTKTEGSGDVYIRGLGDRYLSTTLNGLPIPSDDVEKKNIDLNLFSTDVIQNVGISKTYDVGSYADQTSGNVDVSSKTESKHISIGVSGGLNTNVFMDGAFSNFKATQNKNDLFMGFYKGKYTPTEAVQQQSWNTVERSFPVNYGLSFMAGKKVDFLAKELNIFFTASHSGSSNLKMGSFKKFRSNVLDNDFSDVTVYEQNWNTTGLLNLTYKLNERSELQFSSMAIFKTKDELYEAGRNLEGYVFDQDPSEYQAFVRDQNTKETRIFINQLFGNHELGAKNSLKWAVGYNYVMADEPNRIRNEVNVMGDDSVQFSHVGDYQQRKSLQSITDNELNGYLKDEIRFVDEEQKQLKLNVGLNARYKTRDFESVFRGVRAKGVKVGSLDNMDEVLNNAALYENGTIVLKERTADTYNGMMMVYGGYGALGFQLNNLSGTLGARYEIDIMDVEWDVANYVGRKGSRDTTYSNILPSINLKYQAGEKNSLRFAFSKTLTLPEFKEVAPFQYNSPTGRIVYGNPEIVNSENYNFDLKWEMFPRPKELVSLAGFYKIINDPINLAQARGSSGYFQYSNTGEQAKVYGLELEGRFFIIKAKESNRPDLKMTFNATKMWFEQDLLEYYQYNNKTTADLQGASDIILNGSLTFSDNKEKEFTATVTGNYSSDKVFALGSPESYASSDVLFNGEIIEKGFVSLDLVLTKEVSERVSLKAYGKNLLNPEIEQTQEIKPLDGSDSYNAVVESYRKGVQIQVGLSINLN